MTEWILLMTLHLKGTPGEIKDISPLLVGGFTSEAKCEAATKKIVNELLVLGNKPRKEQGYATNNGGVGSPTIWAKCIAVEK